MSRRRESEPLAESNFRVVLRALKATDERVREVRFRHGGLRLDRGDRRPLDNQAILQQIEAWVTALQDSAAADDYDFAELEAEREASSATFDAASRPSASDAAIRTHRSLRSPTSPRRMDPPSL